MNKEYIVYKDNDVIVEDENGNKKAIKYQDNIKELLTQENLVEILEKELVDLEKSKKETGIVKNNNKSVIHAPLVGGLLGCVVPPVILPYFLTNGEKPIINTVFGAIPVYTLTTISTAVFLLPFCSLISLSLYHNYKTSQKEENGMQAELSFLKQALLKEKARLVELKNQNSDSRNTLKNEFECISITESEKLSTIKCHLDLYYDCGYNINKYSKFYEKGILLMKLKKSHTDYEISLIEEYIGEKTKEKNLIKQS